MSNDVATVLGSSLLKSLSEEQETETAQNASCQENDLGCATRQIPLKILQNSFCNPSRGTTSRESMFNFVLTTEPSEETKISMKSRNCLSKIIIKHNISNIYRCVLPVFPREKLFDEASKTRSTLQKRQTCESQPYAKHILIHH